MLQEDHLIRMINLAISSLLRIVGLKKGGQYEDALVLIDITFERLLGLRASVAKSLDDERLYFLLTQGEQLDTKRLELIADLFMHEGDIFTAQNRGLEGQSDYARALKYQLEVFFNGPEAGQAEVSGKIEYLLQVTDLNRLGSDALWPLASYYEETGSIGKAEAILLQLADQPELRESIRPELIAFYERLLQEPPAILEENGLSHVDIQNKIKRWKA